MNVNKNAQPMTIETWQKQVLPYLRQQSFRQSPLQTVTLLAYFFWDDDRINTRFFSIECAFLCAFHCFGLMPATLVVNKPTLAIERFCAQYNIRLQTDNTLTGGVPAMNIDCVQALHKRFDTKYVLIIQSDGIPIRPGLENFVGPYDYIGAPWPGHIFYYDWFPYPKYAVGNGGFTLRSKKICERASWAYKRYFKRIPYNWLFGDDVFYCKFMRFFFPSWRRDFAFPTPEIAGRFSVEHADRYFPTDRPPLAFHASFGFNRIVRRFGTPLPECMTE